MAGLKCIHCLLISVFSKLKNDRVPQQCNQAKHKAFSWARGEATTLRSSHRLGWQVLGAFLLQVNLAAWAARAWVSKTRWNRTSNHTQGHGAATENLAGCGPGSVLLLTHPPPQVFPPALLLQEIEYLIFHGARHSDTLIDWFFFFFLMKVNPRAAGLGHFQVLQSGISTERADNANGSS